MEEESPSHTQCVEGLSKLKEEVTNLDAVSLKPEVIAVLTQSVAVQ